MEGPLAKGASAMTQDPEALRLMREALESADPRRSCGRCRHFVVDEGVPQQGECRRYPPVPVGLPQVRPGLPPSFELTACTPSVSRIEHCGEFAVATHRAPKQGLPPKSARPTGSV